MTNPVGQARPSNSRPAWDAQSLADPHARSDKSTRIVAMFDAIAPTYERVNTVASLGRDAAWRRKAVAVAGLRAGDIVLDVCCGTGDMVRAFASAHPTPRLVIGVDFSTNMLACGQYDAAATRAPIQLCRGDGLRLPLADGSVDVVSCAFGVRNLQDLDRGLREMHRVLRCGGRLVILEFALPENPVIRLGYRLYANTILPLVGAWISRDRSGAYRYLPRSIQTFERREAMLERLSRAGFAETRATPLNLGSVLIYRAVRRRAEA